jgi:hypothetical protein
VRIAGEFDMLLNMSSRRLSRRAWLAAAAVAVAGSACDRVYYSTMKRFGKEKRDILVNRVKDARKTQEDAKNDFKTALERFKEVIEVEGGKLEEKYEKLNKELDRSEDRAKQVRERIDGVRSVSEDLFSEWDRELRRYADKSLRAESERELEETRRRCDTLVKSMERAQAKIEPVLVPLRDRVLFLKHNLNAQAIGALDPELARVRTNVDELVANLEKSIAEAEDFIKTMNVES